jgi:hypothetical protein
MRGLGFLQLHLLVTLADSAMVTAPARNPSDSSSTSLISLRLCFLPAVRLNEGGVGP